MGYSMRTERFRYTKWRNTTTKRVMARELYDHEKDPHENVNAAAESEYKQDVQRLSQMLKRGWLAALP
jgi:iduronate 2-sulfatase